MSYLEPYAVRLGARRLIAAARLGLDVKENLAAAARLSALTRQEPGELAAVQGVAIGRGVLREAKRQGLSRQVEALLGPPCDVRWVYLSEFPSYLDFMRKVGDSKWDREFGIKWNQPFWENLGHVGPWKSNAGYRLARGYRMFWRDMPKDGQDYSTALDAVNRWMPEIDDAVESVSFHIERDFGAAPNPVELIQKFEAERALARKTPDPWVQTPLQLLK